MNFFENIIIGAGITGLTLARELAGESTLILEKSKGVGGRMATRRAGDFTFDHGAQFYVAAERTSLEDYWRDLGILEDWFRNNGVIYKSVRGGITRLAKAMVTGKQILLNHLVETVSPYPRGWKVSVESGSDYFAKRVFITCPLPQSLQLLTRSKLSYSKELDQVRYQKALVGLFGLTEPENLFREIKFVDNVTEEIFSLANQQSKGVSQRSAFAVTMRSDWSETNFDKEEEIILDKIQFAFLTFLKKNLSLSINPAFRLLKKWRYSHPTETLKQSFAEPHPKLYVLGDAFAGPSIFSASQSAAALVKSFKS